MSVPGVPLRREQADGQRPSGVFRVCHKDSGRWFIGACLDVAATLNRQRFQLERGSHPNARLQRDWSVFGAGAFAFETLAELRSPLRPGPSHDPHQELRRLEALWHERLRYLYGPGYHVEKSAGP